MQDLSGDGGHLDALLGVTVVTDVDLDAAADAPPAAGSAAARVDAGSLCSVCCRMLPDTAGCCRMLTDAGLVADLRWLNVKFLHVDAEGQVLAMLTYADLC